MTFVGTLNAVWMVLGLLALIGSIHAVVRKDSERHQRRWLLLVGVGLIVAALFPYISATDDVLRIDHDQTQSTHNSRHKNKTDNLMRLYEAMETSVVCRVQPIVFHFTFVAFVVMIGATAPVLVKPAIAGRSPPNYSF